MFVEKRKHPLDFILTSGELYLFAKNLILWHTMTIMENKYSGRDLIMFIILVVAVGILGYFIGVSGMFQKASVSDAVLSPTPTTSISPIVTPFPTSTPMPTPTPVVSTPTPSPTPLISGIFGSVIFDGRPVSLVEIRILDSNSNFVKTVVTDIN